MPLTIEGKTLIEYGRAKRNSIFSAYKHKHPDYHLAMGKRRI